MESEKQENDYNLLVALGTICAMLAKDLCDVQTSKNSLREELWTYSSASIIISSISLNPWRLSSS